jgi:diguanylate cyclase (GGDEF)-like protein
LPAFEDLFYFLGVAGTIAVPALLVMAVSWFISAGRRRRKSRSMSEKLARAESQLKEQNRMVARIRGEQGTVATLALSLPAVIRELNRGDPTPNSVPPLIVNLAQAIFQPGHVLFYLARPNPGQRSTGYRLQLVAHHGYAEIPDDLKSIPFGKGKIGWIAEYKLDMIQEDWHNLVRMNRVSVESNHPAVKMEIAGPLVHQEADGERVLGVLCIGSLGTKPRNEKLMFQLVTNLGSLALVNAGHVTKLRELANTDSLTGLLNRRYLMGEMGEPGELAKMINAAENEMNKLSLFIFDIDHFKIYNDTNGHPEGDYLLRELATLLREKIRPSDLCCRYGGEEFLVAMPETSGDDAYRVAERIRRAIEEHPFRHRERQPDGRITISGGVAAFPQDSNNVVELTSQADEALYESKRAGRNRIKRYRGVNIGDVDEEAEQVPAEESTTA